MLESLNPHQQQMIREELEIIQRDSVQDSNTKYHTTPVVSRDYLVSVNRG